MISPGMIGGQSSGEVPAKGCLFSERNFTFGDWGFVAGVSAARTQRGL